jgi:uncharacterized protein
MIIRVDEIPESGLTVAKTERGSWLQNLLNAQGATGIACPEPLRLEVQLTRSGPNVFLRGELETSVQTACVRCLDELTLPYCREFTYTFQPQERQSFPPEKEVTKKELEVSFFQGNAINLSHVIREQILLNIPAHPLCREGCRGLCPRCGVNLNREVCGCQPQEGWDSKLAELEKLRRS